MQVIKVGTPNTGAKCRMNRNNNRILEYNNRKIEEFKKRRKNLFLSEKNRDVGHSGLEGDLRGGCQG